MFDLLHPPLRLHLDTLIPSKLLLNSYLEEILPAFKELTHTIVSDFQFLSSFLLWFIDLKSMVSVHMKAIVYVRQPLLTYRLRM